MNYQDVPIALPLFGMRVMPNPEHEDKFDRSFRGKSATIVDPQGDEDDVRSICKRIKKGVKPDWWVSVKFDNGEAISAQLKYLIPISNGNVTIIKVRTARSTGTFQSEKEAEDFMTEQLIVKGRPLREKIVYDQEWREKIFNEA